MEAEYFALTEVGKKIAHFRQLLADLGFPQKGPTTIFEDNQTAIDLSYAPQITRRSRHIHVRHHYIRDLVKQNMVRIEHLPTSEMTADLLTKPLPRKQIQCFRDRLLNKQSRLDLPKQRNSAFD